MKANHYTEADGKQVCSFVDQFIPYLGLPYYQVKLATDPAAEGCFASIDWGNQRYEATIWLGEEWSTLCADDKRNTVTHEVLHLIHARVNTAVGKARPYMHTYEYDLFRPGYQTEIELMVDQLSYTLSNSSEVVKMWRQAGK